MAFLGSHPLGRSLRELGLLSKPHQYWRWLDHTISYTKFKTEMWAYYLGDMMTNIES